MYKWFIVVNGIEYEVPASNETSAVAKCLKAYNQKRPEAKKMNPNIKKTVRTEGTTYADILSHDPNYVISIRKLGTIYDGGIFK
jgi:hypothetical protein